MVDELAGEGDEVEAETLEKYMLTCIVLVGAEELRGLVQGT